jgi:hypothetical protein
LGIRKIINSLPLRRKAIPPPLTFELFKKKNLVVKNLHRNICCIVKKIFYHQNSMSNFKFGGKGVFQSPIEEIDIASCVFFERAGEGFPNCQVPAFLQKLV